MPTPEPDTETITRGLVYDGLTAKQRATVIYLGFAFAAIALAAASLLAHRLADGMVFDAHDTDFLKNAYAINTGPSSVLPRSRALQVYAHTRSITNGQVLAYLSIGAGMGLFSIGFALAAFGADGRFQIAAKTRTADVNMTGTGPGLLALTLGACLVALGATRPHSIEFGRGVHATQPGKAPSQQSPPDDVTTPLSAAATEVLKRAQLRRAAAEPATQDPQ